MDRMRAQAVRWGAELHTEDVESVDLSVRPYVVRSGERTVRAHTLILATGATAKRLGLPSEKEFWTRGISACAICDGASPLFKKKEVAVVGGGDTAAEEAVYLTKYSPKVHLLVRSSAMRASKAMKDRALDHPNVQVHFDTSIVDAYGIKGGNMQGVLIKNSVTGEEKRLPVAGLFYGIGHTPNSSIFKGVETDEAGYVKVQCSTMATNVEGVFAAGDLQDKEFRQAVTAAGSGCAAALSVERYLTAKGLLLEIKSEDSGLPVKKQEKNADSEDDFDIEETNHRGEYALRKLYHESDRLVAVFYSAPTCGPCRVLKPIFAKVVNEYADKMHYIEIDIEESAQIAESAGVTGTPTIQYFKNKAKVGQMGGVKMKREYREFIEKNK